MSIQKAMAELYQMVKEAGLDTENMGVTIRFRKEVDRDRFVMALQREFEQVMRFNPYGQYAADFAHIQVHGIHIRTVCEDAKVKS